MSKTKIEWADRVWNPVTGCTKVSAGCKHCYAEIYAKRFWGDRKFSDVQCHPEKLDDPMKWKKPQRIFVNSMSDLFHESVPGSFIWMVFRTMAMCHEHTFLILTKRPKVANLWFENLTTNYNPDLKQHPDWPLRNVLFGVSVEDQATADERIPLLLQIPAAVRWISAEPLLGPINIQNAYSYKSFGKKCSSCSGSGHYHDNFNTPCPDCNQTGINPKPIDWVVCGGESGHGARPMRLSWARSLRDQCKSVNVPFFFKQWGAWEPCKPNVADIMGEGSIKVGKSKSGRLLDDIEHNEFPNSIGEKQNG